MGAFIHRLASVISLSSVTPCLPTPFPPPLSLSFFFVLSLSLSLSFSLPLSFPPQYTCLQCCNRTTRHPDL
ncbi:hypothetical protein AB205_0164790 [Aquarana catesbeiana]|uniref:Uncharacterized protein n=1 Tax=Aquarana catesbeiana TaxID=8400 RepID=A0A2G9SD28_AQUCT|nr:hypothetical protein AB205_0164790 [Aquarana catesbeiana]